MNTGNWQIARLRLAVCCLEIDRRKKLCYYQIDLNLQGINNNVKRKSEMV
jgi:hypothetical protein